jgi:quinol monooxygenase YgiN
MSNVKIAAVLTALPGKAEELKKMLLDMVPHCRTEPKNLRWDVWQDPASPGRYALDELYVDESGVAEHKDSPHYKAYLARVGGLAERSAVVLAPLDVDAADR